MDTIKSQLDQLSDLNDEQVTELQNSIVSEFESVEGEAPTSTTVESMTQLADMLDTVRGEVSRRAAEAEELSARAAEAASRVYGAEDMDEPMEEVTEDDSEKEMSEDTEAEVPAEEEEEKAEFSVETPQVVDAEVSQEFAVEEAPVSEVADDSAEFGAGKESYIEEMEASAPMDEPADDAPVTVEDEDEASVESAETFSEVEETAEAATETADEAEASNIEETNIAPEAQEEAPVTAAADGVFEAPADRRPVAKVVEAPVAITAGADIPGYTAGSTLSNTHEVAEAFSKRLHALRRVNGGDGEQHIVASFSTEYPESRVLNTDSDMNSRKIDAVVGPEALVASGGYRTPLPVNYDIFGFGTDARPVKESLPKFQADRGGMRFIAPPVLTDYVAATGVWTNANDITAAAPGLVKNELVVAGAVEREALLDAVTLQLQYGNLLARAYPELVARHNELGFIQHARLAELTLLAKMNAASTAVTTTSVIGFARDFLVQVKRAAAAYRSRHRIDPRTQLRSIVPAWVYEAMAADLALAMPGDNQLGVTENNINGYLASSNVTMTATLDGNAFGAQATGALAEFPDTFTWLLFAEGSFLFLDGGTLDLGIIRDSGLVGTNDYKMFVETFEGLAFVGIESLSITSTINVNGSAAALRDTLGGVAPSVVEY